MTAPARASAPPIRPPATIFLSAPLAGAEDEAAADAEPVADPLAEAAPMLALVDTVALA